MKMKISVSENHSAPPLVRNESRPPELSRINEAYEGDESDSPTGNNGNSKESQETPAQEQDKADIPRWNNGIEFLMSCIAMSVGLGNIWRFPFTAYENGRGAFLVAYFIVVVLIGRPLYYLEMVLGQFSSKGCLEVWACVPLLRGVGYSQLFASLATLTYYCAIMAITLFYFFASFSSTLPWTECKPEWDGCFHSSGVANVSAVNNTGLRSSSELYFLNEVLHAKDSIDDGIGLPDWRLTGCLLLSWVFLFLLAVRGVQSSGKASYFLAIFPYIILFCLMIRGCTLPGALNGILFFIKPDWKELLNPKVWYAAVTQSFFSLSTCFGSLIAYSSYNDFRHNIHRDALIVSVLDTLTSIIAGLTLFAILGNLAYELGVSDMTQVTRGGIGLAFISYPEATSKFRILPHVFSEMFFFMLYVLGAGSAISCVSLIVKISLDYFPRVTKWKVALATSVLSFLIGLIYVTPGGQFIINLVDYYAASFNIFIIASLELIGICWIYGYKNLCRDVEFMLQRSVGLFWKITWGYITPVSIILIFAYTISTATQLKYHDYVYPTAATVSGWVILNIEFLQIPLWAAYELHSKEGSIWQRIVSSCKPSTSWGPHDPNLKKKWEDMNNLQEDISRV